MRELSEMQALLEAYRGFSECVVKSITWRDYGTTVEIALDYIWNPDGTVRSDDEDRLLVKLRFRLVQEFSMKNALRPAVIENPSLINWSFNEIALMVVQADERSSLYAAGPATFYHAALLWETGSWIDVVFSELDVAEEDAAADVPSAG